MNNQNITLVDLVITLTPEILQTDLHTGRRFEDPAIRDHAYGRKLIDTTLVQLRLRGFKYAETTPSGFVMRWKGDQKTMRNVLSDFVRGLQYVGEVVTMNPAPKRQRSAETLRRWYGVVLGNPAQDSAYKTEKPL